MLSSHRQKSAVEYLNKGMLSSHRQKSAVEYLNKGILSSHRQISAVEYLNKGMLCSSCVQYKSFENTVRKGEIACHEQFLLFPQCFLPIWRTFCHFYQI